MEQTQKPNQTKKIVTIVLTVLYYIFIVVLLTFSIITISSRGEDKIPNLFGKGYLAVRTDSMDGENKDSFKVGDLIYVKLLNEKSREQLKVGDVVTYFDHAIRSLNTHRIVEINDTPSGKSIVTQGDKAGLPRDSARPIEDILAVYTGKNPGAGKFIFFLNSRLGFGLLIVLPVFLLFVFQGYRVYVLYQANKKPALDYEAEKEKLRQEILEELAQEKKEDESSK